MEPINYLIYRQYGTTGFEQITTVSASTNYFIDEEVAIFVPLGEEPKNAQYYIIAEFEGSNSDPSNQVEYYVERFGKTASSVDLLFELSLVQNYPNPFNPSTKIKFTIPSLSRWDRVSEGRVWVSLKVFDILGREVATLVNEEKSPGEYEVEFPNVETLRATSLPSGIYFYKLQAGGFVQTKKMILLR